MTHSFRALRHRAAFGGLIAFFLLIGLRGAESSPAPAPRAASKAAATKIGRSTAAAPVVSIEEGLQQIKKAPKDASAYLALGGAYRRAGRYEEAAETYKKLVVLEPNNSTAHVSLGAVYMDLKRPDGAEREFRKAVRLNASDPAAHYNLGNYYLAKGRRDDALSEFRRATELTPPLADAWVSYSLIQGELGKQDDAVSGYKKALAIDSTNVRALTNYANAVYSQGKIPEATAMYRKALQYDPRNQEANYNMGVAFADAQIFKQALWYWKEVVAIDSTTTVAESAKSSVQILEDFLASQSGKTATTQSQSPTGVQIEKH